MRVSRLVLNSIKGRDQIRQVLSRPTWSVTELFKEEKTSIHEDITPDALAKLLKQAGLAPINGDLDRQNAIIHDLQSQLTFVEHVAGVDTENVQPLVRIGAPHSEITLSSISEPPKAAAPETVPPNSWKPTSLAKEKNGDFYILREGLRNEGE